MKINKIKNIRLSESDFNFLTALYNHHYLSFDVIEKIYTISIRQIKYRLTLLEKNEYIVKHEIGSRRHRTNKTIYSIDRGGFYTVTNFNSNKKFDEESAKRLKKGYIHHVNSAMILYAFKEKHKYVQIFSEKECYHFFGDDNNYSNVLRPDGAILNKGVCIFLEYENEQKNRTFNQKIERYERYKRNGLIHVHPVIEAISFQVFFIFNTETKMQNAIEKMKSIPNIQNVDLLVTTLDKILQDPFNQEIYEEVNNEK